MSYLKAKGSAKNIYVIITHTVRLTDGVEEVMEKCEFVDQIKSRHRTTATIILDFLNKEVIKDRNGSYQYPMYYNYICENYPAQTKELEREYADRLTQ